MTFEGRSVLVTGASRGIGREIALYLAGMGAAVAVNYARSEKGALDTVDEIKKSGGEAFAVQGDISLPGDVEKMFKTVLDRFGSLDILVNNAGITKDTLIVRMKDNDWDAVMDTNLKGVYLCTRHASKIMMKNRRGKIINISSIIGITGNAGQANYAAAKAGIIGFSKSVAKELAPRGIQVNVVAPGFIDTDMTEVLPDKVKEDILSRIPLGRYGKPGDVAYAVGFLASDENDYITGQVITVDGGMLM
jgi:3-oxoacyl-[acyl-carrier protein] reductase